MPLFYFISIVSRFYEFSATLLNKCHGTFPLVGWFLAGTIVCGPTDCLFWAYPMHGQRKVFLWLQQLLIRQGSWARCLQKGIKDWTKDTWSSWPISPWSDFSWLHWTLAQRQSWQHWKPCLSLRIPKSSVLENCCETMYIPGIISVKCISLDTWKQDYKSEILTLSGLRVACKHAAHKIGPGIVLKAGHDYYYI